MPKVMLLPLSVDNGLLLLALALPWLNPFAAGPSSPAVQSFVTLACTAMVLPILVRQMDVASLARNSVAAWLIAALMSSVLGLLQYFGLSDQLSPWVNHTVLGEAFANLRQRNQFATLTNMGLAALLWCVTCHRRPFASPEEATHSSLVTVPIFPTAWLLAAAVLLAIGNAASSSRTGLLELLMLAGMFLVWGRFKQPGVRRVMLAAALAYSVAVFALPRLAGLDPTSHGMLARLHDGAPACASRLTLWSNVLHLIAQKPWLGWGWGELGYAHFMTLYPGPRFCEILDNAHNLPLHLAVELGLPVAMLFCGLGVWLVWRSKPWREAHPTRQMAWAVLALIMLHSMLEYPLWYGPFQIAAGLCICLLCSTGRTVHADTAGTEKRHNEHVAVPPRIAKVVAGCLSLLMLAGVAYAGWDYHRISQIYLAPNMRSPAYRENTLEKIGGSWLFRNQVRFAELTTTEVTADNAAQINALAHDLLHFSPEARVAEKLIESAVMLGRDDEARLHLARYRAAFPIEHARWAQTQELPLDAPAPAE